jgi:hypothetical protein
MGMHAGTTTHIYTALPKGTIVHALLKMSVLAGSEEKRAPRLPYENYTLAVK